ncbi:MAG: hypothetical protein ACEY3L_21090 [Wolbachia sp.]
MICSHYYEKSYTTKYTSYEEKENKFIEEAHEYLIDSEFNKNFDLGQYRISNFSGNLTKIELELINEKYMQVQVNRERKIILAIP